MFFAEKITKVPHLYIFDCISFTFVMNRKAFAQPANIEANSNSTAHPK
jgi:hypothetical protein